MSNPLNITHADVVGRLREEFETDDLRWVQSLTDQAVRLLIGSRRALPTWLERGRVDRETVVDVVARTVGRVTANPEGFRSEQEGEYRYETSPLVASGDLWVTEADWRLVTPAPSHGFGTARATPTRGWSGW